MGFVFLAMEILATDSHRFAQIYIGGSVVRWFGGSDSIKNQGVFDTRDFLWTVCSLRGRF